MGRTALELAEARAAALDAVLWGFAGGHIVAVYARTAPAFIAAKPPGPRSLGAAASAMSATASPAQIP